MTQRLSGRPVTQATAGSRREQWPGAGRTPYGFRAGADGSALEADPLTAPVVRRIFAEYVGGSGLQVIAERLTAEGVLRPSAYDPARNPHHVGRAWSKAAVRAIITNDRYATDPPPARTLDAGDTAPRLALVSADTFQQAQMVLARRGTMPPDRPAGQRRSCRYLLRGILRCELCQRLMQGTWNNGAAYYRCRFPREYAKAHDIEHPPNVYLREDRLIGPLHDWICRPLPARLSEWTTRQPPAARVRLIARVGALRELVARARSDRTQTVALYNALQIRLLYEPDRALIQVRSEIIPGAVVHDDIRL